MLARLGLVATTAERDLDFVQTLLGWMTENQVGWDQFFHDWFCADRARSIHSPQAARYNETSFDPVRAGILDRGPVRPERLQHAYFLQPQPANLVIEEVETLWAAIAERDDWSLYEAKLAHIAAMREALAISCHANVVKPR